MNRAWLLASISHTLHPRPLYSVETILILAPPNPNRTTRLSLMFLNVLLIAVTMVDAKHLGATHLGGFVIYSIIPIPYLPQSSAPGSLTYWDMACLTKTNLMYQESQTLPTPTPAHPNSAISLASPLVVPAPTGPCFSSNDYGFAQGCE